MPELEFIPLSINQQISATSNIRLNQPSATSNSNSATSINRGGNVSMDIRGTEAISVGSIASGSGSILNADDTALDVNAAKAVTSRPTSPEITTTTSASASTGTVKSNFRSWFSSNNSSKQQLQPQNTGISTSATSASGNFGMDSNCITSSLSVNLNATNNTTSTTTTSSTTTTTINKNSLNSELQSQQDNNQGSFFDKCLNTIIPYLIFYLTL